MVVGLARLRVVEWVVLLTLNLEEVLLGVLVVVIYLRMSPLLRFPLPGRTRTPTRPTRQRIMPRVHRLWPLDTVR